MGLTMSAAILDLNQTVFWQECRFHYYTAGALAGRCCCFCKKSGRQLKLVIQLCKSAREGNKREVGGTEKVTGSGK